jgi:TP901 family phage tail tape measure protein
MADEGVIRQKLGFDAQEAIDELAKLNTALSTLGTQLGGMGGALSSFNSSASQTVSSLKQMSTAAETTLASMSKLSSGTGGNVNSALGMGKVTESIKQMQNAANLGLGTYSGALTAMSSQTRTASSSIVEATGRTNEWVVSWNTLSRVIMTQFIVRALSQIRDAFSEAYTSALAFSKAVSEIHAINPERSFGEIADSIRKVSDAFNQPLSRVAEANYQIISDQFVKVADQANIMTAANALAKVGADDLAASAQLLTGALNAYGESSDMAGIRAAQFFTSVNLGRFRMAELGTAMGRVQSISHEMGISMEEVQASLIAITIGGVKASEAATQLRSMMTALMKPSEAMTKALHQIGADSGQAAIATWDWYGALEKLRGTTDGSAAAMAKLIPNVRGVAGAMRILGEGAKAYKESLETLKQQDLSTLQKQLKDFMNTPAEQLTKELNKLANYFTVDFGLKMISMLNTLIQLIGGGGGLIGIFNTLGTVATAATFVGLVAGLAKLYEWSNFSVVGFAKLRMGIGSVIPNVLSLRGALATLALFEVAALVGNKIGTWIQESIAAPQEAIRTALDAQIKMREAQTAATIRLEQTKSTESIQILRQHFAAANALYLKDVENYKSAMKVQVDSVKNSFDKIMQMRYKLTQELGAQAEAASKRAISNDQKVAENKQKMEDRTFNTNLAERNLSPEWQYQEEVNRMRQIADQAAKLQATAKDSDQQKLADDEWRRAEAYAQMAEQSAKASGNINLQREAARSINDLTQKQNDALNKQSQMERQIAKDMEARQREAEKNNASLERDRDAIEKKLIAYAKSDTGETVEKTSQQKKADLAESYQMIQDFIQKVQTTTKGDFLKNYMGDAGAFKQMQRDVEHLLSSTYLKELKAAPEAMAMLRTQLQESLDKAGLTVPVIAKLEKYTGKEAIIDGVNAVFNAAEKRLHDYTAQAEKYAGGLAKQQDARNSYNEARKSIDNTPMTPAIGVEGRGYSVEQALAINVAQDQVRKLVAEMDKLSKATSMSDLELAQFSKDLKNYDLDKAFPNFINAGAREKYNQAIQSMIHSLEELNKAQRESGTEVPEKERKEAETIQGTIDEIRLKKEILGQSADTMQRETTAADAGKLAIDSQFTSVNSGLGAVATLEQSWWRVEAAARAAAAAAAAASLASSGGGSSGGDSYDYSGGGGEGYVALGGLIRHFDVGGFVPRGTDTVPAMLSPGEFVMNRGATQRWFSHLVAMNAGSNASYRSQGGNVANVNVGDININGSAQPRETGREVLKVIKRELRRGTSVL